VLHLPQSPLPQGLGLAAQPRSFLFGSHEHLLSAHFGDWYILLGGCSPLGVGRLLPHFFAVEECAVVPGGGGGDSATDVGGIEVELLQEFEEGFIAALLHAFQVGRLPFVQRDASDVGGPGEFFVGGSAG
jgi:hypothetical protein